MRLLLLILFALPLLAATALLDGAKVEYTATGKGKTALVLIHGWTCDRTFWDAQVPALAAHYRVVALDLPGHGVSAGGDNSMKHYARAVNAVMEREKIARAVLVGHSMGGAVMLEFARLYPKKLLGIVAVDANFMDSETAPRMAAWAKNFEGPNALEVRQKMVRGMFTEATSSATRAKIEDAMLKASPETAAGAMRGMADASVWKDGAIDTPMLEVAAPTNTFLNEASLKKRFPRAKLARVEGTGHFLHMEKPQEVNRIILDWLKEQKL